MAQKAPFKLSACPNTISVSGTAWSVTNEDELARLVGLIFLGRYRQVENILKKLKPGFKPVGGQAGKEAKAKLTVASGQEPWHRDGLLFQAISWIAAHQASENKSSVFSLPHLITAHKGFDGVEIELTKEKQVAALVVFEDKATENPRSTIRTDVWPEVKALHRGQRQTELMQEVTALLERAKVKDADAVVEAIVWKQARKFRVSITGLEGQHNQPDFDKLFKGYDDQTPGLDETGRRAEVFCHADVRKWMQVFATKVAKAIDKEVAKSNV
jgi:hypothetical protein